jgi:hypothetical protein
VSPMDATTVSFMLTFPMHTWPEDLNVVRPCVCTWATLMPQIVSAGNVPLALPATVTAALLATAPLFPLQEDVQECTCVVLRCFRATEDIRGLVLAAAKCFPSNSRIMGAASSLRYPHPYPKICCNCSIM